MEFELWLFAVKQLAQSYEMSQVIYSQLTDAEKADLHKEYDATIGGGSSGSSSGDSPAEKKEEKKKDGKTVKEYTDLINNFHNAMSIVERFVEKNNSKNLDRDYPIDPADPDEEFLRRIFLNMEIRTIQVLRFLSYTAKSVTYEGELRKEENGFYYLNEKLIAEGQLLEFFYMNRWEIGILCKGPGTAYGYFILGFQNEIFDVNLDGLKVRLRG
ncbi:MAG: hypothetical protein K5668_08520 [Lachnospiraceae bacterium]|nr:hypothetical protein [Lachnospiraceae bacterium]